MQPYKLLRCTRVLSSTKYYSLYSKDAVYPVTREKHIDKVIESGEAEIIKKLPIRAAHVTETSSQFSDVVVNKFINYIMEGGKKELARKQMFAALAIIKYRQVELYNKTEDPEEKSRIIIDPLRIMKMAVQNCRPLLKLCSVRRGGSNYQVPTPISDRESVFRSMKGIVNVCRDKDGAVTFRDRLAQELIDASQNKGRMVKQKIELHRICEANRAYIHYRWG